MQESQWLLKRHTYGLLQRSFRRPAQIGAGAHLLDGRRAEYVQQARACIQRMQKALTEMNRQLAAVWSDLSGTTGRIANCSVRQVPCKLWTGASGSACTRASRSCASRAHPAPATISHSDSYLGAQFRRFRSRLGAPKAMTATAAKVACLIYRMLRCGQQYVDRGTALNEEKYRVQQVQVLEKKAAQLEFVLRPAETTIPS